MKSLLVCSAVLCLCRCASPQLHHKFFVNQIFEKYGNSDAMTYEGFEHLLENLGLGELKFEQTHDVSMHRINGTFRDVHDELDLHRHDHGQGEEGSREEWEKREKRSAWQAEAPPAAYYRCLSPQDILVAYGLRPDHDAVISQTHFTELCPAIVYELDHKSCWAALLGEDRALKSSHEEYYLVWIYAAASVVVMSVAGLLCVTLVPVVHKAYYKHVLHFLVALAVGTLCGDALIHLLPTALSYDPASEPSETPVLRGTVVLFAILVFYVIETFIKALNDSKSRDKTEDAELDLTCQGRSHGHSHGAEGEAQGVRTVAWMVIMGDVLHNVTDGLSIGAAFSSRITAGVASSIAIFCHELPHEMGDYAVLLRSGMTVKRALMYNLVSSGFSFLGMVGGVLLGELDKASLWINAFTAGTFLYIALSDMVPELKLDTSDRISIKGLVIQLLGFITGAAVMFIIALYEDDLEAMFQPAT